ncbi:MAG: response regulator transcription factor [Chitinophagales bacterium]|nr:response regulator transcription factor [Chitinophagales bacterium]
MTKLQCLIVEDEPLAAEVLMDYIRQVPFLHFLEWCTDAVQAMDLLRQKQVDVIFLDLHLPGIKGFELLKTLSHKPQIIITTAYHEYALQGYEWQVTDYLVKPVEFSRFLQAANKLISPAAQQLLPQSKAEDKPTHLFVTAEKKQVKIVFEDILYIESQKDYLKIVLKQKNIIVRQPLHEMEQSLPATDFIRIHRSYLVAKAAIETWDASEVEVQGQLLPIGRNYREQVQQLLRG